MTSKKRKIAIAADHVGVRLKSFLVREIDGVEWLDLGPDSENRVDYPDFAAKLAQAIQTKQVESGVLICGTGIGMCIAANKFCGIRATATESIFSARLAREHNDSNVLCLGARIIAPEHAKEVLTTWLETSFEGGRHQERLQKILNFEKK